MRTALDTQQHDIEVKTAEIEELKLQEEELQQANNQAIAQNALLEEQQATHNENYNKLLVAMKKLAVRLDRYSTLRLEEETFQHRVDKIENMETQLSF